MKDIFCFSLYIFYYLEMVSFYKFFEYISYDTINLIFILYIYIGRKKILILFDTIIFFILFSTSI